MLAGILLVAASGKMADVVFSGSKRTKTIQGLARLRTNIQQLYGTESSYSTLTTQRIINAGGIPSEFVVVGSNVKNPFGGNTVIAKSGSDLFYIQIQNIPQGECQKILTASLNGIWNKVAITNTGNVVTTGVKPVCRDKETMFFFSE